MSSAFSFSERANRGRQDLTLSDLDYDQELTSLQRIERYLSSSIPLQRLVHLKLFSDTAQSEGLSTTVSVLLPLLGVVIADEQVVVRQEIPRQICRIAIFFVKNHGHDGYTLLTSGLLPCLARLFYDSADEVRLSASKALVQISTLVHPNDIGRHVLALVLRLSHDEEDASLRMAAVWLLNNLASSLGQEFSAQFLVPEILSLSEDPEFRVRRHVARNLCRILEGSHQPCVGRLVRAFEKLTTDESSRVRKACTETIADISVVTGRKQYVRILTDAFSRLLDDPKQVVRTGAYMHLGGFMATLQEGIVVPANFISSFVSMPSMDGDASLRLACAFQFPAVVLALGKDRWPNLRDVFFVLVRSAELQIRKTLSFSFHEVVKVLGSEIVEKELLPVFHGFLKDEEGVKMGVIVSLAEILSVLSPGCRDNLLHVVNDVLGTASEKNWRLREVIADQLSNLGNFCSPQSTWEVLIPIANILLADPVSVVRNASIRAIPSLVRSLSQGGFEELKKKYVDGLLALAKGTFQERLSAVVVCIMMLRSEDTMTGFRAMLQTLAVDPTPGVRISLIRHLKREMTSASSNALLHELVQEMVE